MDTTVIVEDTTLRDGEQAPGVALSARGKMEILLALEQAGIPMIEIGTPSMGGQERAFVEEAVRRVGKARLVGWNRAVLDDLKCSVDCGLSCVHIGVPASDIQMDTVFAKGRAALYHQVEGLIDWCKARNLFVSVSAEDSSRTPVNLIMEYATVVRNAGADRIRLSDTLGLFSPFDYYELVRSVREVGIDVHVHAHNDLGLAMGNVVAGIRAGAKYVHVTVNGWSERVGHPSLELVAIALKRLFDIDTGIDLLQLPRLSALVARLFHRTIPPWQPVIGSDVFTHESGIHVAGTLKNENAFEPFPPSWIGREHQIIAGKHSGSHGVQYLLERAGISIDRIEATSFLPEVRDRAIALERALTQEELVCLYRKWKHQEN